MVLPDPGHGWTLSDLNMYFRSPAARVAYGPLAATLSNEVDGDSSSTSASTSTDHGAGGSGTVMAKASSWLGSTRVLYETRVLST